MALSPSRRDTIGPPPRDVTDLARVVRHQGSYLRSLDPGLQDGRFATPRPVPSGGSQLVGDDGGDSGEDIAFENGDRATAASVGRIALNLTYEPIDGSLHVRWNGIDQPPTEWTLDDQLVTFTNSHIKVGDVLTAAYAYYPTDPGVATPASALLRGSSADSGSNSNALGALALPADTQIGDLIVVSYASANVDVTNSDSRLTHVGTGGMLIGFATSLGDLNITAPGGFGSYWSVACLTFATNATGWTAAANTGDTTMAEPDTIALGTVAGVGFAVASIWSWHNTVTGNCDTPVGWTEGRSAAVAIASARVDYWLSSEFATSPPGPSTFTGGPGGVATTVVGLIGPSEDT